MAPKGQQLPPPGPSASPNSREKAAREQFFSLRPSQSTSSHKTFLRISLHPSVLANLDLKAGGLCCVHAAPTAATPLTNSNGSTEEKKSSAKAIKAYPALAWPASDPHITGKVALVSESIREMLRVGFEHKVLIGKYIGKKDVDASEVFLIEVAGDGSRVTEFGWEMEGEGWRYMVENALGRWYC